MNQKPQKLFIKLHLCSFASDMLFSPLDSDKTMSTGPLRSTHIRKKKQSVRVFTQNVQRHMMGCEGVLCSSSSTMTHKCFEATTQGHSVTEETPACLWADSAWPLSRVRNNLKQVRTPTHTVCRTITHLFFFCFFCKFNIILLTSSNSWSWSAQERVWEPWRKVENYDIIKKQ